MRRCKWGIQAFRLLAEHNRADLATHPGANLILPSNTGWERNDKVPEAARISDYTRGIQPDLRPSAQKPEEKRNQQG